MVELCLSGLAWPPVFRGFLAAHVTVRLGIPERRIAHRGGATRCQPVFPVPGAGTRGTCRWALAIVRAGVRPTFEESPKIIRR